MLPLHITEVSIDEVLTMLAFIEANSSQDRSETLKDALAMILPYGCPLKPSELYEQVVERSEVLEGVI